MLTPVKNMELHMLKIAIFLSNLQRCAAAAAGLKPPSTILMLLVDKLKVTDYTEGDVTTLCKNETL